MNCNITATTPLDPITLGELKRMKRIANKRNTPVYNPKCDLTVQPDAIPRPVTMTVGIKIYHNEYDYEWLVDDECIVLTFEDKGQADEWLRLEGFREEGFHDDYEIVELEGVDLAPMEDLAEYWLAVFGDDDPALAEELTDPNDGQLITPDTL